MRLSAILTVAAGLLGLTGMAHAAQTIASPAIYASPAQTRAACVIGNTGTQDLTVDIEVLSEAGTRFGGGPCFVEANFICTIFAPIPNGQAVACSATVPGSADKLRGSLVLYDASDVALTSTQLR